MLWMVEETRTSGDINRENCKTKMKRETINDTMIFFYSRLFFLLNIEVDKIKPCMLS